jgi:zinc protease
MTTESRKHISIFALTLAALPTALAQSQAPPAQAAGGKSVPLSKVERKRKAPVSSEILRVKLPKATEVRLSDGLRVLLLTDHRFPIVSMRLEIEGAGSLWDPPNLPGLAHLTATMLREGTATRNSKQVAEDIERLGASLNASAPVGGTAMVLTASGLRDNLPQWLALVADVLLNPTFPKEELAKLEQRQKGQLAQMRAQPNFLLNERFNRVVYGEHPAAVTSATLASLDAITPEMVTKWHAERYVPQNAILGIAGDVSPEDLMGLFNGLPAWNATEAKAPATPATKPAVGKKIVLVDRPGSVQTDVAMGNIAVDRASPDYLPLVVMDRIVGGSASARLFLNLREEKGYTYGVYSQFIARQYAGPWSAGGSMRTDATEGAMTEFMKEIRRIRDEKVPEAELEEAKRAQVAGFALSLEQPEELLEYAMTQRIYRLPADYWETYPAKIMLLTAEDIQRVAKKYLDPDNIQIAAVGDANKIKPVFEKLGPVEVYDIQGKRIAPVPAAPPPSN